MWMWTWNSESMHLCVHVRACVYAWVCLSLYVYVNVCLECEWVCVCECVPECVKSERERDWIHFVKRSEPFVISGFEWRQISSARSSSSRKKRKLLISFQETFLNLPQSLILVFNKWFSEGLPLKSQMGQPHPHWYWRQISFHGLRKAYTAIVTLYFQDPP